MCSHIGLREQMKMQLKDEMYKNLYHFNLCSKKMLQLFFLYSQVDLTELPPLFCGSKRHSPKLYAAGFGEFTSRRPSFAPRGSSFDRNAKDSQIMLQEQQSYPLPHPRLEPLRRRMNHSTSMDQFPNKHISRVSSLIKRSCRSLEVQNFLKLY